MNRDQEVLCADLRSLIGDLGIYGGLTSPSIYDTAQLLRLQPPAEGVWPALDWLISQQHEDGGWGDPALPLTRDVPTLAAILALRQHDQRKNAIDVQRRGLAFLKRQACQWAAPLPDDIPAAVELLLPRLLDEAAAVGLELTTEPYSALLSLGQRRRRLIAQLKPRGGTAAVHSWEAWGGEPDPLLLDASGGVGHSPAATAAWLVAAGDRPELADHCHLARRYLAAASASTGSGIAGVVPNAWPIARTEQATALYALLLAGVLDTPALAPQVSTILAELHKALTPTGLGTSDYFATDSDDTAMAVACLAGRYAVAPSCVMHFAIESHFCTYVGELQPSVSATAHAVHALTLLGQPVPRAVAFLKERRAADGRWFGDKWNGSWIYTTCHTLAALLELGECRDEKVLATLLAYQHNDGGWGTCASNSEETAYGVATLLLLKRYGISSEAGDAALTRAQRYLRAHYRPFCEERTAVWLAKEPYRPRRVSRAFEVGALLALSQLEQMEPQ